MTCQDNENVPVQGLISLNRVHYTDYLGLYIYNPYFTQRYSMNTRHNSANSVPTSNLISITEVAIRTTFSHMISIAGIYYTCSLVIDIQCIRYKNADNKRF